MSKQAISEPDEVIIGDILAIKRDGFVIRMDDLDPKENNPKPEPIEQTEEIKISGEGRTTRIGTFIVKNQKKEMGQFLKDNFDVFTWSVAEMPSISLFVICHSLNVNPVVRLVKQKKRKFALEKVTVIR